MRPTFDFKKFTYPFKIKAECRRCTQKFIGTVTGLSMDDIARIHFFMKSHTHQCGTFKKKTVTHELVYAVQRPSDSKIRWLVS